MIAKTDDGADRLEKPIPAYREPLPEGCPPEDAHGDGCELAFRLVSSDPAAEDDFVSNAAQGRKCPRDISPCRWASCSLFVDRDAAVKVRNTFPKMRERYKFVAAVNISPNTGRILQMNKHLDFWMFSSFKPLAAILRIEAI